MWPATGGHGQGEKNFIGLRCIAEPDIHGVEVRHEFVITAIAATFLIGVLSGLRPSIRVSSSIVN